MLRSIKYELNPTGEQQQKLNQTFGCCRFVYNWALNLKIETYQKDKTQLTCFDLNKRLTLLKQEANFLWLSEVGAQQLQQSTSNLDSAFTNFFKSKKGFPKFKTKSSKQSFRIVQKMKINYSNFTFLIPKTGYVKFYKDKQIEGTIKFATVSKTSTGRYFVSITYETLKPKITGQGEVGVDLGIKNFTITSDGQVFENQKYLKQNLKKLRVEQRKLQRKFKKGSEVQSNNYQKQRLVVAKLHEKIAFQRKDYLHKVSTELTKKYHTICIEDLNVAGMVKNKRLSKAISDCGWGMFRQMLEYKAADLRVIGRFEPSSQICNVCGDRNHNLKLSDRVWTCKNGHTLDRDLNAAKNIKDFGLRASTFNANVEQ